MSLPEQLSFSHVSKEVKRLFDRATLTRGKDYLDRKKVLKVTSVSDGRELQAKVLGSWNKQYSTKIKLFDDSQGLRITCHCSCPVQRNCKHAAAVLLGLPNKPLTQDKEADGFENNQGNLQVKAWLSKFDRDCAQISESSDSQPEGDEVIYVLQEGENGINANIKRSKMGKKGDYLKGTKIALSDFRYHMPQWIQGEDKVIIQLLSRRDNMHDRFGELSQDIGYLALMKMIATGRCFWDENRIPIAMMDSCKLGFEWRIEPQGKRLKLQLTGCENALPIYTQPPTFIDLDYLKVGLLDTELDSGQLKLLAEMPPVPEESLSLVNKKLMQHFPVAQVPLPLDTKLIQVDQPCKPVLTLTSVDVVDGPSLDALLVNGLSLSGVNAQPKETSKQPVAKLEFAYGTCRLPANSKRESISIVKKGTKRYQVSRALDSEAEFIEQLEQLGFYPLTKHAGDDKAYWNLGSLPQSLAPWLDFIDNSQAELQAHGWSVDTAKKFDLNYIESDIEIGIKDDEEGWFSLSLHADIEGQRVPMLPLVISWLQMHGEPDDDAKLILDGPDGKQVLIPAAKIRPLVTTIQEIFLSHSSSASHQPIGDELSLPPARAALLNELSLSEMSIMNGQRASQLAEKMANFNGIEDIAPPRSLKATLREYQAQGLSWLCFLREYQLGGILADDMGLGKTIQTLAFLLREKELGRGKNGSLIICPTSLVGNWLNEATKFAPTLNVVVSHGSKRAQVLEQLSEADIIVTTYPLMVRDQEYYFERHFDHLILDEAQLIKNAQAKVTQVVKDLRADFKLCLSGTPLENHLGELKSLMDFCLPGLLGQQKFFGQTYRTPIEKHGDLDAAQGLKQKIAPFILRRTKEQVASELPPKTEIDQVLELEKDQRNLYESIRLTMEKKLRAIFAKKGAGNSQIEFLDALLKLRQSCCDARLVKLDHANSVTTSAKLDWLRDNLPEMIEEGRKVIIFSQFTSMLDLIELELKSLKLDYSLLTGQTQKRQEQIDAFQEGEVPVFLISLKAGGTGLNLTAADTVIHYDPWWNPAIERQATDRAYRIGQDKPVFVYKLITQGTVEEKIQLMQQHKQSLADSLFASDRQSIWQGDADELIALLQ